MRLYFGVVEDNNDPLKISRCRVRVFGMHSDDRGAYPTADLPWAIYISNGSNISGEGDFRIPNNGDYVVVSFIDPEEQIPVILGSLPKVVKSLPNFNNGFSDPNQIHPKSDKLDESSLSRLAINENIDESIIQDKKDNRTTGVQCVGETWDEPETQYNATYPNNRVISTKNHVIEMDDTEGYERLHIYHKSGTSIEMHPNGDSVELIKAKKILIVESDENILVKGNLNFRVEGNENKQVVGKININSGDEVSINITGDVNVNITGEANVIATGDVNIIGDFINLN